MFSSAKGHVVRSTSTQLARKCLLSDLPDDVWYTVLPFLSGSDGSDVAFALSLSALSPRFDDLFMLTASSITEITTCSMDLLWLASRSMFSMSVERFDCRKLFKHTTSLRKIYLSGKDPSLVDDSCIQTLANSAVDTLEYVDVSFSEFQDCTLLPLLKCRKLHTLICVGVMELTGSVFARENVGAPIRKLNISRCGDFTAEGLRRIFELESIYDLILDDLDQYSPRISIGEFIKDGLSWSRLAKNLQRVSLQFNNVSTEDVLEILKSMPSLRHLRLFHPYASYVLLSEDDEHIGDAVQIDWDVLFLIDPSEIEEYKSLFPNVRIELNSFSQNVTPLRLAAGLPVDAKIYEREMSVKENICGSNFS